MRSGLKQIAERALVDSGIARFAGRRVRGRTLVLAYHNIVPTGVRFSGDSSLHLPQSEFARQLDVLAESHDVLPIDALIDGPRATQRPGVIITFDDAYTGAITAGLDELRRRGMPATVFVAPGLLGCVPWWDCLATEHSGVVPDDARHHALEALRGDSEAIISWASRTSSTASTLPRIATEPELGRAASKAGVSLGSHTWSHQNLTTLTPTELDSELLRPLDWLRSRFVGVTPWLTYPYGLFNAGTQTAANKAGYVGALGIDGGWMSHSREPAYALPRLNIPAGLSLRGFRLRLAGL